MLLNLAGFKIQIILQKTKHVSKKKFEKKLNKIFIVGAFDEVNNKSFNTAAVFLNAGNEGFLRGKYYKHQLVPFGETVPFKNLFIKFGYNPWGEGSIDLTAGEIISPVNTPLVNIGFNICYETTFTYISRLMVLKNRALSLIVAFSKKTTLVIELKSVPGSLNPIWPFLPIPRICKSIPPFSLILFSYHLQ